MIILKGVLTLIAFSLPLWAGFAFNRKTWVEAYLFGQVALWAIFQLIAVPMIWFRCTFTALWVSYLAIVTGLTALGIRKRQKPVLKLSGPWTQYIPLILAGLVILGQAGIYVFGMHLDEDDARWIAEANDALVKNRMLLHNPATGEYIGRFVGEMQKDVFSPWAFYLAFLSRITTVRAVVLAHTVYPPILLLLSYAVYYQIGKELFKGQFERGLFLLMVAVINIFFAGNAYTQSVFTLTRIWQGKAVVAAVMIPLFMLCLLRVEKENTVENWLWFAAAGCAACLFSGMGIAIGLIVIGVYGLYAIIYGIVRGKKQGVKRIPLWLLSLVPGIIFGLGYYIMKG